MSERILAINISGTIASHPRDGAEDATFGPDFLSRIAVPGAIEAVASLAHGPFRNRVIIMALSGQSGARVVREWLSKRKFYSLIGEADVKLFHPRDLASLNYYLQMMEVTHYVDSSLGVLEGLPVTHRYLFERDQVRARVITPLLTESIALATSWSELVAKLGAT